MDILAVVKVDLTEIRVKCTTLVKIKEEKNVALVF